MRRLFDVDPATKSRTIFHYEDLGRETKDKIHFQKQQDVTDIIEWNQFRQNEDTGRWGDVAHIARIPNGVWEELEQAGIAQDDDRLDKWLMDSDNRKFRTKLGNL